MRFLLPLLLLFHVAASAQTIPPVGTASTFDVATWNIKEFGQGSGAETQFDNVLAVVSQAEVDLWALQEVNDQNDFNALVDALGEDYASDWTNGNGSIGYGFIYRTDVVQRLQATTILGNFSYEFASRPPLLLRANIVLPDTTVQDVRFIDLHAKCCGDLTSYDRRLGGAEALKNYVDNFLVIDAPVLVLGDFNDEMIESISGPDDSPYQNFLDDPVRYRFLNEAFDQPGQPNDTNTFCSVNSCAGGSVLDYILATEPLLGEVEEGSVARYDAVIEAFPNYTTSTSDHAPVYARFDFASLPTDDEDGVVPTDFALHAPFPNPFRDATTLTFALPEPVDVRLEVFDALGRRVATVIEGAHAAGTHEVRFVERDLTPGLYLVRLTAGSQTATRRLVHVP